MPSLDRFSAQAAAYARFRIGYPAALYEWLLPQVPGRRRAWDCATGNGQVAVVLANHFESVLATDLSQQQLDNAVQRPNIWYQLAPAENTPLHDSSIDLITVAQAVHWFDTAAYHREVRRVAGPGAVLAEWGYGLAQISPEIDPLVQHFYRETMGPYWDENRWHIDDEYARLPFPFGGVRRGHFAERRHWSAAWFLDYLRTWSSVQRYQKQHGTDPVALVADELMHRWGPGEREVVFPIFARTGSV